MKQYLYLVSLILLSGCVSEDGSDYVQEKAAETEPENYSVETANEISPPDGFNASGSSSGVFGEILAGQEKYYYVDVDFFDSGAHQITLSDMTDDLDLTVTDWDGVEYTSQASGVIDEVVSGFTSSNVSFFGDDIDTVRVLIKVNGGQESSTSRFTLTFTTFDDD